MAPEAILRSLVAERTKSMANGMRGFALAFVASLWLSQGNPVLDIELISFRVQIKSVYLNIFLAWVLMSSFISFMNYMTLNEFIRIASNRLFKHDASWAITILEDGSNAWSIGHVRQFRFLSSGIVHSLTGLTTLVFMVVPFIGIYVFIYFVLATTGWNVIKSTGWLGLDSLFFYAAWLFAAYPIIHTIISAIPFQFHKNISFIRWNFLYRIHKRTNNYPRELDRWLADK